MITTHLWAFFFESAGTVTRKATGSTLGGSPLASLPLSGSEKRYIASSSISPNLHVNSQVFYSATLRLTLQPSVLDETDNFPSVSVSLTLSPQNLASTNAFYSATVLSGISILPALFSNTQTFFTPSISAGVLVTPTNYTNAQVFYTTSLRLSLSPTAYTNSSSFFSPSVIIPDIVSPALWINTQTFFSPSVLTTGRGGYAYDAPVKKRKKLVFPYVEEVSAPEQPTKAKVKKAKKELNASAVAKIFSAPENQRLPAPAMPRNLRSVTREYLDAWFEGNQKAELAAELALQRIAEQSLQDFLRMESVAEEELTALFDLQQKRREKEMMEEEYLMQLAWRAYFES